MELNTILVWMAGISTGLLLVRLATVKGRRPRGWLTAALVVLAALTLSWALAPDSAGFIGGGLWGLLIMTPMLASRAQTQAIVARRWRSALWAARLAALTHPADGLREQPLLVKVLAALDEGREGDIADELVQLDRLDSPLSWTARVLRFRAAGDWQGLADWVEIRGVAPVFMQHAPLFAGYVRALGELGRISDMLAVFERFADTPAIARDSLAQALVRAQVAAFVGRRSMVDDLFEGAAGAAPAAAAEFWKATAEQVRGDPDAAAARLRPLLGKAHLSLDREIRQRLESPLPMLPAEGLDPDQLRRLHDLGRDTAHERRFAGLTTGARRSTPVTTALMLVLIVAYAFELPGGPTDLENLIDLGALVVPATPPFDGWWRWFTAGFLHFGPVHLAMNVAGLMLLGRWVERTLGGGALLACQLLCTLASIALYPLLSSATEADPNVVVGASGGIMGLLGALLGILIVGRLRGPSVLVASQLRLLLLLVVLQVVFDSMTPQVSSLAHLLGLGAGVLFGLVAGWVVGRER